MMARSDIEAGAAYVRLFVKNQLGPGLASAKARLESFAKTSAAIGGVFTAAGGGVFAGITAALAGFASSGDELSKLADRTGASVESLSELRYAAGQSDVSMSALETGFKQMGRTIGEAHEGVKEYEDSLTRLGLTSDELINLPVDERFMLLADRISKISDPSLRAAAAMDVFGRAGTELLPLFVDGERGMSALRNRARALGLTMSGEQAAAATLLGDTWDDLTQVFKRAVVTIGTALAPQMQALLDKVIPLIVRGAEIAGQYSYLAQYLPHVGVGLLAVGGAFLTISAASQAAALAIGAVQAVIGIVAGAPMILALTGIGVAIALAWHNSEGFGDYLAGTFVPLFESLATIGKDVWGGMAAALKQGDMKAAGEVAMLGLQAAMASGMVVIIQMWEDLKYAISEAMAGAVIAALDAFDKLAASPFAMAILGPAGISTTTMRRGIGAMKEDIDKSLRERKGEGGAAVADAQARADEAAAKLSERTAAEKAKAAAAEAAAPPKPLQDFEEATTVADWLKGGYAADMPEFREGMQTVAGWLGKAGSFAKAASEWEPLSKGKAVNWWDKQDNPFDEGIGKTVGAGVTGTFSAAAAAYLGAAGSPAERTARGIERLSPRVQMLIDIAARQEKIMAKIGVFG
jgi:hypothetical protein